MSTSANNLSPAEHERLAKLMEECGELIQTVGKIMRHGWNATDYTEFQTKPASEVAGLPYKTYDNRKDFEDEMADVFAEIQRMCNARDVNRTRMIARASAKLLDLSRMNFQ